MLKKYDKICIVDYAAQNLFPGNESVFVSVS